MTQRLSPGQFRTGLLNDASKSIMRWFACNSPFQALRISMYRKAGVHLEKPRGFGGHVWIDMWAPVSIAEDVLLGGYTFILTHTWMGTPRVEGVTIKRGAEVGVRAVIMPGVTIGEYATVGAGSVVTRDVPAYAVVAGSPARLLRMKQK